jgi:hypothetical protein
MLHAPDLLAIALCAGSAGVELGPMNIINGLNPDKLYDNARAVVTVWASLGDAPVRVRERACNTARAHPHHSSASLPRRLQMLQSIGPDAGGLGPAAGAQWHCAMTSPTLASPLLTVGWCVRLRPVLAGAVGECHVENM